MMLQVTDRSQRKCAQVNAICNLAVDSLGSEGTADKAWLGSLYDDTDDWCEDAVKCYRADPSICNREEQLTFINKVCRPKRETRRIGKAALRYTCSLCSGTDGTCAMDGGSDDFAHAFRNIKGKRKQHAKDNFCGYCQKDDCNTPSQGGLYKKMCSREHPEGDATRDEKREDMKTLASLFCMNRCVVRDDSKKCEAT